MSDRVAVFNDGVVQQCAAPAMLYEQPSNAFVADFIGENNFIPGQVADIADGTARVVGPGGAHLTAVAGEGLQKDRPCMISVRPEKLFIRPTGHAYDNEVEADHVTHHYVGDFIRYYFRFGDGTEITVKVLNDLAAPDFSDGDVGALVWLTNDSIAFPA